MFFRSILPLGIFALLTISLFAETRAERTQKKIAENPKLSWWDAMDTGPFISDTFFGFGPKGEVATLKGIAIKRFFHKYE